MILPGFAPRRPIATFVLLSLLTVALGCARPPAVAVGPPVAAGAVAGFAFATDTFAFPNEIRARNPGVPGLYANYCFVLARAARQFFAGARFEPSAPKLDHAGYVARVRAIVARPPWAPALTAAERVVIPGYANLREFSRGEEPAVKAGLGGRFWTLVHWTNWRVTFRVTGEHQAAVAEAVRQELAAGRLVQLLVTNWPKPELNHGVVAFAFRESADGVEFSVWDPNDLESPGLVTFLRASQAFHATRLHDTEPGVIRAFRMSYSWLL
jgi:hypothetical protein